MLQGDPRFHSRLRRLAMLLWVVVGVMYLAMAIPVAHAWLQTVDDQVFTMAVNAEASQLVGIAEVLTIVGGNAVTLTLVLIVAGLLYWKNRPTAALLWVGAVAVSEAIIWASKFAYGRPRPPLAVVATHSCSFPSGHAGTAAAVAAGVVLMLALRRSRHWYFERWQLRMSSQSRGAGCICVLTGFRTWFHGQRSALPWRFQRSWWHWRLSNAADRQPAATRL